MPATRVRGGVSTPTGAPYRASIASCDAGDLIIVAITTINNKTPNKPTDDAGNDYNKLIGPVGGASQGYLSIFLAKNIAARVTTNQVSITFSGGSPGAGEMTVLEYNPQGAVVDLESSGTATGTGTNLAPVTGVFTSTQKDDLFYCYLTMGSTPAVTAGATGTPGNWSKLPSPNPPDAYTNSEDSLSNSASTSNTGKWTTSLSVSWTVGAVALKMTYTGTAGSEVKPVAVSGSGKVGVSGTVACTLKRIAPSLDAKVGVQGPLACTLSKFTPHIEAIFSPDGGGIVGNIQLKIPKLSEQGTGHLMSTGTVALSIPKLQQSLDGWIEITGTIGLTMPKITQSADGWVEIIGDAALNMPKIAAAGTGNAGVQGTGGLSMPKLAPAVAGKIGVKGTGAMRVKKFTVVSFGNYQMKLPGEEIGEPETGPGVDARFGPYTIRHTDRERLITFDAPGLGDTAVTVPEATGAFGSGWRCWIQNKGTGTVTLTPASGTINGAGSLVLIPERGIVLVSDGANWQIEGDLN